MNSVNLVGRLTRDPDLRTVSEDRKVCDLRLAYNQGRDDTGYITVAVFDGAAEACAEHLSKGRQVAVSGRLVYREWENDGQRRSEHQVIGRVEFLGPKPGSSDQGTTGEADDIPF